MSLPNDIVLRPRFQVVYDKTYEELLGIFDDLKKASKDYIIHRLDEHIYLKMPVAERHIWSPQLHLELERISDSQTKMYGVFGPNPGAWTLFMFIHFVIASCFIGFGIWAYVEWRLDDNFQIPLFLALLMVVFWILLYFIGRFGKSTNKPQMARMYDFLRSHLNT